MRAKWNGNWALVGATEKLAVLNYVFRLGKIYVPALRSGSFEHAGYSATTLLPGEDSAAFEKLHRALIAEFSPVGTLEEDIVSDMARLIWRKQNLATFRIAELAQKRDEEIRREKVPAIDFFPRAVTLRKALSR